MNCSYDLRLRRTVHRLAGTGICERVGGRGESHGLSVSREGGGPLKDFGQLTSFVGRIDWG